MANERDNDPWWWPFRPQVDLPGIGPVPYPVSWGDLERSAETLRAQDEENS